MKLWEIRYWISPTGGSPIEKWLDKLTKEQLKLIFKEISMLKLNGKDLKLPHSRALGEGLFELRERRYGYRIYYCFRSNLVIILLAAGSKKSQENDIKIARERLVRD